MTENELEGLISRINQLAKKSKAEGLTDEEKDEQAKLRQQYLANFRKNFRSQLEKIDIKQADGKIVNLTELRHNKSK